MMENALLETMVQLTMIVHEVSVGGLSSNRPANWNNVLKMGN